MKPTSMLPVSYTHLDVYKRQKEERVRASKVLSGPKKTPPQDREAFVRDLKDALYAAKLISYAQGYTLMRAAAKAYGWNLHYGNIALMWRGGCIIRSACLGLSLIHI